MCVCIYLSVNRSVVILSHGGYIKRIPITEFEHQSRGGRGKASLRHSTSSSSSFVSSANITTSDSLTSATGTTADGSTTGAEKGKKSEGDTVNHFITCNNRDTVLLITDRYFDRGRILLLFII